MTWPIKLQQASEYLITSWSLWAPVSLVLTFLIRQLALVLINVTKSGKFKSKRYENRGRKFNQTSPRTSNDHVKKQEQRRESSGYSGTYSWTRYGSFGRDSGRKRRHEAVFVLDLLHARAGTVSEVHKSSAGKKEASIHADRLSGCNDELLGLKWEKPITNK